jgi:flagellin-specific chaperone FliS
VSSSTAGLYKWLVKSTFKAEKEKEIQKLLVVKHTIAEIGRQIMLLNIQL